MFGEVLRFGGKGECGETLSDVFATVKESAIHN